MLDEDGVRDLPAIGVLSVEELEGVRPLPLTGVDVFLGVEEPKPTGVCLYGGLPAEAPDLMLEVLRTPPRGESSESKDRLDPVLDGGLEPFLDPGWADWRRV